MPKLISVTIFKLFLLRAEMLNSLKYPNSNFYFTLWFCLNLTNLDNFFLLDKSEIELNKFPKVSDQGIIQLKPTKLYVEWYNNFIIHGICIIHSINNIE